MIYRAHAVLRCDDRAAATERLRDQLRIMAVAGGVEANWSSLSVEGPLAAVGMEGGGWCAWAATVSVGAPVAPPAPVAELQGVGAAGIEPATARL